MALLFFGVGSKMGFKSMSLSVKGSNHVPVSGEFNWVRFMLPRSSSFLDLPPLVLHSIIAIFGGAQKGLARKSWLQVPFSCLFLFLFLLKIGLC